MPSITDILALPKALVAGPCNTAPVSWSYFAPWQGQIMAPSDSEPTAQPAWVQVALKALNSPARGWVINTSISPAAYFLPLPTGTSVAAATTNTDATGSWACGCGAVALGLGVTVSEAGAHAARAATAESPTAEVIAVRREIMSRPCLARWPVSPRRLLW